jgi:hypothetical protein
LKARSIHSCGGWKTYLKARWIRLLKALDPLITN